MNDSFRLSRFVEAQDGVYASVTEELKRAKIGLSRSESINHRHADFQNTGGGPKVTVLN